MRTEHLWIKAVPAEISQFWKEFAAVIQNKRFTKAKFIQISWRVLRQIQTDRKPQKMKQYDKRSFSLVIYRHLINPSLL